MNSNNLRPANTLSESELREMASNGGKKSGEVRREKARMKDAMRIALQMAEKNETLEQMMQHQGYGKKVTQLEVLTQSLIMEAKKGNPQAYNAIRDIVGEKPTEKVEGSIDTNIQIGFVETEIEPVNSEEDVKL